MGQKRYISVILPLKLDWVASYSVPEEMGEIEVGDRVRVVFANRKYLGVVSATDVTPDVDLKRVMSVISVERDLRRINPEEIKLWQSIAEYYLCSIGEVYKTAYTTEKISGEESHAATLRKIENSRRKMIESIEGKVSRLEDRLAKKLEAAAKTKEGTKIHIKTNEDIKKIQTEIEAAKVALEAILRKEVQQSSVTHNESFQHPCFELSDAQKKALTAIQEGFASGKPVMLHGVTGSGKTEIYIKLAKEALSQGRNVLYLVPEIALSRQLEDRLLEHFTDSLMTYHSGKSSAIKRTICEKMVSFKSAAKGGYIVLGTRSSLFLPHHNLGLIIVDEEHDNSYKQDSPAPYYNGRDTALMLSVIHTEASGRCNIILGSATPSLEERYNCLMGKHMLVELRERYHRSDDSDIEIIDTKAERRKNGMKGNFSRKLIGHIETALSKGHQVMILRSRRAWAPVLQCENCGAIPKCPHCNVSLSLHKNETNGCTLETIVCHHCGFKAQHKGHCSRCGSTFKMLGAGTQRIEEEAKALFPGAVRARLDSDITQSKNTENQIIKDFGNGKIDILIGTQIVAKGFDFSRLNLVAVIAADTLLGMQDFRADEQAVQLLEQFRGRCGRRDEKGLLVIQTSQPEHPVYQSILQNEAIGFSSSLLQERQDFGFPPYSRIIELTVKDIFEDRAERMATKLAEATRRLLSSDIRNTVTGPYPPAVSKVSDNHIRVIRVCLRKDRNLPAHKNSMIDMLRLFEKENRYNGHITVNVDPS